MPWRVTLSRLRPTGWNGTSNTSGSAVGLPISLARRGASRPISASVPYATVPRAGVAAGATAPAIEKGVTGTGGGGDATVSGAGIAAGTAPSAIVEGIGRRGAGGHAGIPGRRIPGWTTAPAVGKARGPRRWVVAARLSGGRQADRDGQGRDDRERQTLHGVDSGWFHGVVPGEARPANFRGTRSRG